MVTTLHHKVTPPLKTQQTLKGSKTGGWGAKQGSKSHSNTRRDPDAIGCEVEVNMSQKTWGGRFTSGTDARVEAFTESISFDRRLYRHDIRASQAHARMLAEVGLLTATEAEQIAATLDQIGAEIDAGTFAF